MNDKAKITCRRCGREGFLSGRWVRSSYQPKYFSELCDRFRDAEILLNASPEKKDEEIQLTRSLRFTEDMIPIEMKMGDYVTMERKRISGTRCSLDKTDKDAFRVRSKKKYFHYYVGHYDSDKYKEQMERYRSGKRKSRPNGRTWCKLPNGIDPQFVNSCSLN